MRAAAAHLPVLHLNPAPIRLEFPLTENRVDQHRRVYCRHYDGCLDQAEAHGWASFSCSGCPVRDELTLEERRADAAAIFRAFAEQEMVE